MKNILYILTATFLISSCRSIDKMIDAGNYEEAYRYGIDKLIGKKERKTKYVKALEKAYHKLNEADHKEITRLKSNGSVTALSRVVDTYERMEARQNYIAPLLPLISKDGYRANIENANYIPQIIASQKSVSDLHFDKAELALIAAKTGDRKAARSAYKHYKESLRYFDNYRGASSKLQTAYELGQTYILIENYVPTSHGMYNHAATVLQRTTPEQLNSKWQKYVTRNNNTLEVDYIATIEIEHISSGTERERYNSFVETKKIVTGQKKVPKKMKKTDTIPQYKLVDITALVTAQVEELFREKESQLIGKVTIIDASNQQHIRTLPLTANHIFEDYAMTINGDRRALTQRIRNRYKEYCAPFPSDYDMVTILAESFSESSMLAIDELQLR